MNPGVSLLFGLVFGLLGYRESKRFADRYGRTPFGWPSLVWAFVCFLSLLVGGILLMIGRRVTRRKIERSGYANPAAYGQAAPYGAPPGYGHPYGAPPATDAPGAYGVSPQAFPASFELSAADPAQPDEAVTRNPWEANGGPATILPQ